LAFVPIVTAEFAKVTTALSWDWLLASGSAKYATSTVSQEGMVAPANSQSTDPSVWKTSAPADGVAVGAAGGSSSERRRGL
jgi:hypothetical protein